VDYERDAGGDEGQQTDASEAPMTDGQPPMTDDLAPMTDGQTTAEDAGTQAPEQAADANPSDASDDFGTDAGVMDESFENHESTPPEWPAADFATAEAAAADGATSDAPASSDDSTASAEIAATYAAATEEPSDLGDDSDAPILEDATPAASATIAAADEAMPQSYIQADNVTLRQAGAQTIQASTVTVSQGGAGQVNADTVSVEQGGLGLARTKTLTLGAGASAFAVVADEATVQEGSNAFLVVSRTFNGDVQPTIDWRVAAAFGAGLGLALSILRRLR
jgi:hypothetical protein